VEDDQNNCGQNNFLNPVWRVIILSLIILIEFSVIWKDFGL